MDALIKTNTLSFCIFTVHGNQSHRGHIWPWKIFESEGEHFVSFLTGKRIISKWRPNKKRKRHLSPRSETNIYHLPPSRSPLFLIGHYL
jgi:hypothetical protein